MVNCRLRDAGAHVRRSRDRASRVRRRVRSEPSGAAQGEDRKGRMGESARVDSCRSPEGRRHQTGLDDRRRQSEFTLQAGRHARLAANRHRDHRRRLPVARLHAAQGERPQHHVHGRTQAVPRFVRDRRAARRLGSGGKEDPMRYLLGGAFLALCLTGSASAQSNDYSDAKSWLCRPDLPRGASACDIYHTVSTDTTPNSDMVADPAEKNVIRQQFSRFGSVCRTFAPLYRQVTLAGLRRAMAPGGVGPRFERGVQYDDVRDAWKYYLEHENKGRGFVLVAHSQGSFIVAELIRQEIDGKPIQSQMVSAILLGTTLAVPKGKDVGGAFQHVPLCRSTSQTGCVITYASYRSTLAPPSNTLFGKVAGA